jgi:hypothetical protein
MNRADVDEGLRPGVTTDEKQYRREREHEDRELRHGFLRAGARPAAAEPTSDDAFSPVGARESQLLRMTSYPWARVT